MRQRLSIPLLLVAIGLTGCFKKPEVLLPPPPSKLAVKAEARPQLNLDPEGESMSVVVHVYQLKDKAEFQKLTFDLISSGRPNTELFPQDLVSHKELILVPGTTTSDVLDLNPSTRFVGLVGQFRKPDVHAWRQLVPVEQMVTKATATAAAAVATAPPKGPLVAPVPVLTFKAEHCYLELQQLKAEPLAGQPAELKPICLTAPVVAPAPATEPAPREVPKPALKQPGRSSQRNRHL